MALWDYLREEIEEEAALGLVSEAERDRRLALLDRSPGTGGRSTTGPGGTSGQPGFPAWAQASADPAVGVDEADPAIGTERLSLASSAGTLSAYLARPAGGTPAPGIVVVHENKGLVPYVEDVARRLAKAGYVAIAPDLLSRSGGTSSFAEPAEATAALGKLQADDLVQDLLTTVSALAERSDVDSSRLGAVGFCFGGGMTWRLATKEPRLAAAVPFYGPNPPLEDVAGISAAVLAIYGADDARINAGIEAIEAAMNEHGKLFEKEVYEGAGHAFHNDTNPDRYSPTAAAQAWQRAVEWFDHWLRAAG